jgi:predicted GNAT family N-acyltransferase
MNNSQFDIIHVETPEQLQECFAVRFEVFVEEQKVPRDIEIDEYDASPSACRHLLIRDRESGQAVATGRWKPFEEQAAKLQRIAVLKPYRGYGIGRLVLDALESDARAQGYRSAVLDGQTQAEPFYSKLGYRTISSEPFLDAGIWHVRMQKSLE